MNHVKLVNFAPVLETVDYQRLSGLKCDYATAKEIQRQADNACKVLSDKLQTFPRNEMGLTPDSVRSLPEWKAAKQAYTQAFAKFQAVNVWLVKTFAAERKAERNAKRS